jgi:hypothetical protein
MKNGMYFAAMLLTISGTVYADTMSQRGSAAGNRKVGNFWKNRRATDQKKGDDQQKNRGIGQRAADSIGYFIEKAEGQSVTIPSELLKEYFNLCADGFDLMAGEVRDLGSQIPDGTKISSDLNQLASEFRSATSRIPSGNITKILKNLKAWAHLKARKLEMMGKKLEVIANQLNDPKIRRMATMKKNVSQALSSVLEKASKAEESPMLGDDSDDEL